jgi:hypothetical protein
MDYVSLLAIDCLAIGDAMFIACMPLAGALVGYATVSFARSVGVR